MRSLSRIALTAVIALLLVLPGAAHGAFPGANGKLAFFYADQDIYIANPDGSGLTNLTNDPNSSDIEPSWSANGVRVAWSGSGNPADPQGHIFFIQPSGVERTQVTNNPSDQNDTDPSWSPDGRKIAFADSHGFCSGGCWSTINYNTIPGVHPAGGAVLCCSSSEFATDPSWSPDGTKIAFMRSSFPASVPWSLWTIDVDGSNLTRICCDSPMSAISPDWSPDGQKILFQNIAGDNAFYTVGADGTGLTHVYSPPSGGFINSPAWSPDGTRIAFAESPGGGAHAAIYTMKLDGSDRVRVTPSDAEGGYAFVSWQAIPPNPYTGYPRPKGASPFQTYLVPAYKPCTAPNGTHGAPLAFGSCSPPQQASDYLTIGTPDANGQPAKSRGVVKLATRLDNSSTPADEADIAISVSVSDVRNKADLTDYTGSLQATFSWRMTDNFNGEPSLTDPATLVDVPIFPVNAPCTATDDATVGSTCSVTTSGDAIIGSDGFPGHKRTVFELGKIDVLDGGDDGDPTTDPPSTLFLTQGLLIP